jgi:hypothetical protein
MAHWTVDIDEEGNVVIEGHGFKGKACELPPDLMSALGQTVDSKKKPEYHQNVGTTTTVGGKK